jgi:hypothetical protein
MFDDDIRDLSSTLSEMQRRALDRCKFDQIEAKVRVKKWVSQDRRFDAFDPEKLVQKVYECRASGSVLNLDDGGLRKGGSPTLRNKPGISGW